MISVHKFGGTSVASAERIQSVAQIIESMEGTPIIVVSAMADTTSRLVALCEAAAQKNSIEDSVGQILQQHLSVLRQLEKPETKEKAARYQSEMENEAAELESLLKATSFSQTLDQLELISSFGEPWCARLMDLAVSGRGLHSQWVNSRNFLNVRKGDLGPEVDWELSQKEARPLFEKKQTHIVTGYLAKTISGQPTTLQRNGSDWTASILAYVLDAQKLTIWKDVDGIMSTDPRIVEEAFLLKSLSYEEAAELAHLGARVLHPKTIQPAQEKSIPIFIRNSLRPEVSGTSVVKEPDPSAHLVKGFAVSKDIGLISIEGKGMSGVPGTAHKVFDSLREEKISATMISQAGSEQSICVATDARDLDRAVETLKSRFFSELHHGFIEKISSDQDCAMIAAVGDGMITKSGVAARFCGALASNNISIKAIAQGSSERNISLVVRKQDCEKSLRAAHAAFYLSETVVNLGIIGPGQIGKALIKQIHQQRQYLRDNLSIDFQLRSLMNSQKMETKPEKLLNDWKGFDENSDAADMKSFEGALNETSSPYSVVIDCTASEKLSALYPNWLEQGHHIVTPNKKANSREIDFYQELQLLSKRKRSHYYYESTVGAGLPIISTLQDLIQTGDKVETIKGILSGTLSYIFNEMGDEDTFSSIVLKAKSLGFTEPDPRDDLSGMDVARKLVILAREAGLELSLDDIEVESLVPTPLNSVSLETFLQKLPEFDAPIKERFLAAQKSRKKLAFVAQIDFHQAKASVGLEAVPLTSSLGTAIGSDNIVEFTTERYKERPLVVKGPGAGPEVTAAGVFSDLLRLGQRLQRGLNP